MAFKCDQDNHSIFFEAEHTGTPGVADILLRDVAGAPSDASHWAFVNEVDEFGDSTGNSYLEAVFCGQFSNTATTSSDLQAKVIFEGQIMRFRLLEYSDTSAVFSSGDELILKTKIDGEVNEYELFGKSPNGDLLIASYYNTTNYNKLVQAIYDGKEVSCVVYIGSSKYNFTISGSNFANEYNATYYQ